MADMDSLPRSLWSLWIMALVGVIAACLASQLARGTATRRAATHGLAASALD
jgi:hypothetical protein